jgi:NodT family efflux transporter outer membrane factor (OMF) lipoprotein
MPALTRFRATVSPAFKSAATAVSLAVLLSACAAVPTSMTDKPIALSDLSADQTLAGDARGQWPDAQWWTAFNDPQLNALMDEALTRAPDIKAAKARFEKAQSYYDQVRAVLSPTATANVSTAEQKGSINMGSPSSVSFGTSSFNPKDLLPHGYWNLTRMTIDANYDLDLWGKSHDALKGSLGLAKAARIEEDATRDSVALSIARGYVELDRLYKMKDALLLVKKGADMRLDLMQQRADHELETADAVLRVKDDQTHLTMQLAQVDGAIKTQGYLLAALAGEGPDRAATLTRPQLADISTDAPLPADLPANLLGRRPDVIAARLRIEAQSENIKYTRADFYPNLSLTAYVGQQALSKGGFNELFASGSGIGSIGPAISLPLFNGGRLKSAYRGAEADYDSAVATYDSTLTTALQQVADAAAGAQSTSAQLAAAQTRADDANKTYELSKARFGRGLNTKIDVLLAHAQWVQLQDDVTNLKAQAYDDRLSLIAALGGGYQPTPADAK